LIYSSSNNNLPMAFGECPVCDNEIDRFSIPSD
jgi:hypothetical protein